MTATLDRQRRLLREDLAHRTGADVRMAARAGRWSRATHGLARGYLQANLAIVRERYAFDFLRFCQRNPQPCPVIDVTDPGNPEPSLAAPAATSEPICRAIASIATASWSHRCADIKEHWHSDSVAFLLGCSNSMDEVLLEAGIPQRHLETEDGRISVYVSNIQCRPAGLFHGPVVVTMRPIPKHRLADTIAISARYPQAHGTPVHVGDPGSASASRT